MKTTAATVAISMVLASTQALALPHASVEARQDGNDQYWEDPNGNGNVQAEYGDNLMSFGHLVPSSTLDLILEGCGTLACKPGSTLTEDSVFVSNNRKSDAKVALTIEGSFNRDGEAGDAKHLVAMARTVMQQVYEQGKAQREQGVMYITGECPESRTHGCLTQETHYVDQWKSTDHVIVRYEHDDGKQYELNVGFSITSDGNSLDAGLCAGIFGVGGAFASAMGAVAAPVGIVTSLFSLGCAGAGMAGDK